MSLIPMDRAVLLFLIEQGGECAYAAIPNRLFRGDIPEGHPSMTQLGLVEHMGENVRVTDRGRDALVEEKSTTDALAAIGVRHEPHPEYGCRMLYAGNAPIGPMDVRAAYAFLRAAESAA